MKYLFGTLVCALIIAGCIFQAQESEENLDGLQEANVISIELIGDELVRFENEAPIKIAKLKAQLMKKVDGKKPIINISANEDITHGDLIDVQNILRDANMLRINYSTKSSG